MTSMRPEVLRQMVDDARTISPPLINREPGKVNEMEILYNRIDQQVELISVLKQRLDEMTKRWQRSEAEHEQQEKERSKVQQAHNKLSDKFSTLEIRWNQLSDNHREMISLKDEYKGKVASLQHRMKELEAGESAALASERGKYQELYRGLGVLRDEKREQGKYQQSLLDRIAELEATVLKMTDREKLILEELEVERNKHRISVSELQLNLDDRNSAVQDKTNQNAALSKEIQKLTDEIINRGKIVQDKDSQIKQLESQKAKTSEKNELLKKELDKLHESINSNRILTDVKEQLVTEKEKYRRLERELVQFKNAAKEELRKEQSVNAELRHVSARENMNNRNN